MEQCGEGIRKNHVNFGYKAHEKTLLKGRKSKVENDKPVLKT